MADCVRRIHQPRDPWRSIRDEDDFRAGVQRHKPPGRERTVLVVPKRQSRSHQRGGGDPTAGRRCDSRRRWVRARRRLRGWNGAGSTPAGSPHVFNTNPAMPQDVCAIHLHLIGGHAHGPADRVARFYYHGRFLLRRRRERPEGPFPNVRYETDYRKSKATPQPG